MSLDDIAAFLKEERAVRAALRPTYWLADVPATIEMPNESKFAPLCTSEIRANSHYCARNSLCCAGSETRPKSRWALARAAFLSGLDRRILTTGSLSESVAHVRYIAIVMHDRRVQSCRGPASSCAPNHPSRDPTPSKVNHQLRAESKRWPGSWGLRCSVT